MLKILPLPEKFLDFHPPKFLMTFLFLVIDHKFRISPIFPVSVHFLPVSRKLLFPPTFKNFLPVLEKFTCFLHTLCVHPMHVLDAPGKRKR